MRAIAAQLSELQREMARTRTELTHLAARGDEGVKTRAGKTEAVVRGARDEVQIVREVAKSGVLHADTAAAEPEALPRSTKRKLVELNENAKKLVTMEALKVKRLGRPPKSKAKAKREDMDEEFLTEELTQDEQLLVATGRGRRGEVLSTPLGYAYWTKEENETLLSIGAKINVEPLTLYSMNRWKLKLKQFSVTDEFLANTRLWIVPHEDWEHQYIKEDRSAVLQELLKTVLDVWPDHVTSRAPLCEIRSLDIPSYESSGQFYDEMCATLSAAEVAARAEDDAEKLRDLVIIRQEFDRKWLRDGFLPPDQILQR